MTPKCFWDKNSNMWELHSDGTSVRVVWEADPRTIFISGAWIPRWKVDRSIIGPLVGVA